MKIKYIIILIFIVSIVICSENNNIYLEKANAAFRDGNYDKAIEFYNKSLDYNASEAVVYYNLANVYYLKEKPWKSIAYYQKVIRLAPDFINSYLNLGKLLFSIEEYYQTIKILEKALELNNDCQECYLIIGTCYKRLDSPGDAVYYFEKAREKNPLNITVYYFLAETYLSIDDYDNAIKIIQTGVELKKDDFMLQSYLAGLYQYTEEWDKAINVLDYIIQNKSDDVETYYYRLAEMYMQNKQTFLAIDTLQEVIEKYPTYLKGYSFLGTIYFDEELYSEAEKVFLAGAKRDVNRFKVYLKNIAIVYYRDGDKKNLQNLYNKIYKVNKSFSVEIKQLMRDI